MTRLPSGVPPELITILKDVVRAKERIDTDRLRLRDKVITTLRRSGVGVRDLSRKTRVSTAMLSRVPRGKQRVPRHLRRRGNA
jgi:hypothetical protein